jgi:hypothetical protein
VNSVSCLSVHEHYLRKLLWAQGGILNGGANNLQTFCLSIVNSYRITLLIKMVYNFNANNAEEKNK